MAYLAFERVREENRRALVVEDQYASRSNPGPDVGAASVMG
jgi:hypothetical protein